MASSAPSRLAWPRLPSGRAGDPATHWASASTEATEQPTRNQETSRRLSPIQAAPAKRAR